MGLSAIPKTIGSETICLCKRKKDSSSNSSTIQTTYRPRRGILPMSMPLLPRILLSVIILSSTFLSL